MESNVKTGIYRIVNLLDGKNYIGSAVNIDRRWKDHRNSLNSGKHHSQKLQRAWTKHGANNFGFFIVELVAEKGTLIAREQFWMDSFKVIGPLGYNVQPTAGSWLGLKHSAETKAKLSEARKGIPKPPHVLESLRNANLGRKLSPEHCAKQSAVRLGKPRNPETILKTAAAHRGMKRSDETRKRMSEACKGNQKFLGKRHSAATKLKISIAKIGALPTNAKLSFELAEEIRAIRKTGESMSSIGRRYGVTKVCIRHVVSGKTWKPACTDLGVEFPARVDPETGEILP